MLYANIEAPDTPQKNTTFVLRSVRYGVLMADSPFTILSKSYAYKPSDDDHQLAAAVTAACHTIFSSSILTPAIKVYWTGGSSRHCNVAGEGLAFWIDSDFVISHDDRIRFFEQLVIEINRIPSPQCDRPLVTASHCFRLPGFVAAGKRFARASVYFCKNDEGDRLAPHQDPFYNHPARVEAVRVAKIWLRARKLPLPPSFVMERIFLALHTQNPKLSSLHLFAKALHWLDSGLTVEGLTSILAPYAHPLHPAWLDGVTKMHDALQQHAHLALRTMVTRAPLRLDDFRVWIEKAPVL